MVDSKTDTLVIEDLLEVDALARFIADKQYQWTSSRATKVQQWQEVQQYVFATDTSQTHNHVLPWSNRTTIPKLCQIRDNLYANYMAAMFPSKRWANWEGSTEEDDIKADAIEAYMNWVSNRNEFYQEIGEVVLDFIDYGNAFVSVEWSDERAIDNDTGLPTTGFIGPVIKRISPIDIVFDVTATSFAKAPKIIRSYINKGEVKALIESLTTSDPDPDYASKLMKSIKDNRDTMSEYTNDDSFKDDIYTVAGFKSYRSYLDSSTVEVLTFYGDYYDQDTDTLMQNQIVRVIDRTKVISQATINTISGKPPIHHVGWRKRPDNLIAMGPLENLVGMQYRIDHLENLKSDIFDILAFPPIKVTGDVAPFEWGPFERIEVGDSGDISLLQGNISQALQADTQVAILEQKMEEMAGSPKEAAGFRTPGEKTAFEFRRLENAASRTFNNKIGQFERELTEPSLNNMLELARSNITAQVIRSYDNEFSINTFTTITDADLSGNGTIIPTAARHFAEKEIRAQSLNQFFSSPAGQDPEVLQHFSSIKLAGLWEELMDISNENLVSPYVRISERADAQRLQQSAATQLNEEAAITEQGTQDVEQAGLLPPGARPSQPKQETTQ